MKKVFKIIKIENKDIHVPSTDYYARNNQPKTDSIEIEQTWVNETFKTEEDAEKYLLDPENSFSKGEWRIVKSFIQN